MDEFEQFLWAIADSTQAALIGLNIIPVCLFSLVIGLVLPRGRTWLKAPLAVIPAMLIAAIWPWIHGAEAIWPDLMQMETEIQAMVLFVIAWASIWLCERMKALFMPVDLRRPIGPIIISSQT